MKARHGPKRPVRTLPPLPLGAPLSDSVWCELLCSAVSSVRVRLLVGVKRICVVAKG